nr:MAG TPA: hypothetical protein [Caudoviricetes sp.]
MLAGHTGSIHKFSFQKYKQLAVFRHPFRAIVAQHHTRASRPAIKSAIRAAMLRILKPIHIGLDFFDHVKRFFDRRSFVDLMVKTSRFKPLTIFEQVNHREILHRHQSSGPDPSIKGTRTKNIIQNREAPLMEDFVAHNCFVIHDVLLSLNNRARLKETVRVYITYSKDVLIAKIKKITEFPAPCSGCFLLSDDRSKISFAVQFSKVLKHVLHLFFSFQILYSSSQFANFSSTLSLTQIQLALYLSSENS